MLFSEDDLIVTDLNELCHEIAFDKTLNKIHPNLIPLKKSNDKTVVLFLLQG